MECFITCGYYITYANELLDLRKSVHMCFVRHNNIYQKHASKHTENQKSGILHCIITIDRLPSCHRIMGNLAIDCLPSCHRIMSNSGITAGYIRVRN